MKDKDNNKIRYKSDVALKQIRSNIMVILSYVFIIWLWQFTVSFQSSMYNIMNFAVAVMLALGTAGTILCKEDREAIIKTTKHQICYYLIVVFVYDMFYKIAINSMTSSATSSSDTTLITVSHFLVVVSTILKVGHPIGFLVWMIQKFAVYKNGITKQKQMEVLRNISKNILSKNKTKEKDKDNINNRY